MKQFILGLATLVLGLLIGGVGIATAGIGVGIPLVPVGMYLIYEGWRKFSHEEESKLKKPEQIEALVPFHQTRAGKCLIGIFLVVVGAGASAFIIGIPIAGWGLWLIYDATLRGSKKFNGILLLNAIGDITDPRKSREQAVRSAVKHYEVLKSKGLSGPEIYDIVISCLDPSNEQERLRAFYTHCFIVECEKNNIKLDFHTMKKVIRMEDFPFARSVFQDFIDGLVMEANLYS